MYSNSYIYIYKVDIGFRFWRGVFLMANNFYAHRRTIFMFAGEQFYVCRRMFFFFAAKQFFGSPANKKYEPDIQFINIPYVLYSNSYVYIYKVCIVFRFCSGVFLFGGEQFLCSPAHNIYVLRRTILCLPANDSFV